MSSIAEKLFCARTGGAIFLVVSLTAAISASAGSLSSPDGLLVLSVTNSGGNLSYLVARQGTNVIESSPLGISLGSTNLGAGVTVGAVASYTSNVSFPSRHGIHAVAYGQFNGQRITISHTASGIAYILHVVAFTNGVGIRYEFTDDVTRSVTAESTGFVIPADSTLWHQSGTSVYEGTYGSSDITSLATGTALGPPVTIQLPGTNGFLALTEAALGGFPNPYLTKSSDASGRLLKVTYPVNQNGTTGATINSTVTNTPWNIVMVGLDLNTIVNNDMVESISPPPDTALFPQGAATSWATTGRSVWDWLNPQPGGITSTNAMTNSFWAAQLGYEYNTIDEGWANWNGGDPWPQVQTVANFSHARGVKVLLWKAGIQLNSQAQRTTFFQQLTNYGVDGIKADFFDFSSVSAAARERVALQENILREAAAYRLVVNFHGTSKPTGQFRTYPNLLQFEGVFGKEQFTGPFSETIPPFGRFLAGPADFTPLALQGGLLSGKSKAFEIASVVAMPGPLITIAERSDIVADSPFVALIKSIPTMWDETIVLPQSQLGQTTAMVRRKGADWYLAVMNLNSFRSFGVPLTFLSPNITYQVYYVRDSSAALESMTRTQADSFPVLASAGGGEVAWFSPVATNYPPVVLQMGFSETNLQLTWSQGTLLEAANVNGPWNTNLTATSPFILTPGEPQKFYRVQVQ